MLTVQTDLVGSRPAGQTRGGAPRVRAAVSATRAWGLPISLDAGATDANDPMSPSIPAITSDGGGHGTDGHALGGTFDSFNSWQGAQRALLIALALAQL